MSPCVALKQGRWRGDSHPVPLGDTTAVYYASLLSYHALVLVRPIAACPYALQPASRVLVPDVCDLSLE